MSYSVFFDLDDTILNCKSLCEVLKYYYIETSPDFLAGEQAYKKFFERLKYYELQTKSSRAQMNRYFYQQFSSFNVCQMQQVSVEWFYKNRKHIINKKVHSEMIKHQSNGANIVIVTGSFEDCVRTIADFFEIPDIICSKLEVENGCYTGNITGDPVIGKGKQRGIINYSELHRLDLSGSYAYGDHISDIHMLSLVDNPVVVGTSKLLFQIAEQLAWERILPD
ncbi:HAD-IB family hydrolase [Legionella sp. CNM-4043-24]|uniref:HAD-IB family hydrolase n=1 Tax=Legionella sp. CNM-4043-24 TaxID=3421646 RepID=UPI00403ABE36